MQKRQHAVQFPTGGFHNLPPVLKAIYRLASNHLMELCVFGIRSCELLNQI